MSYIAACKRTALETHVIAHFRSGGTYEKICSAFEADWIENGESFRKARIRKEKNALFLCARPR